MAEYIRIDRNPQGQATLYPLGKWQIGQLEAIERELRDAARQNAADIDASQLESLDTAGAWTLERLRRQLDASIDNLKPEYVSLLELVSRTQAKPVPRPHRPNVLAALLIRIGKASVSVGNETLALLRFVGETSATLWRCLLNPRKLRFTSIVRHVDETGIDALPIVGLIAFLISVVLAYQGASQLRRFGAEIFTINMVAVSVLREMGVLLTAIMVAGRSGSAFTAEIGVMKVNEEVDAMRVIGMSPFEVLVLPRLIALAITMPMLTFLADIMGLLGGGIICYLQLGIPPVQYIEHFRQAVAMSDFWVGIVKAPVFASLIAVVGCMRGMEVSGSAESVGRLTTVSVVHSIFLVLLADALFSILFTKLGV